MKILEMLTKMTYALTSALTPSDHSHLYNSPTCDQGSPKSDHTPLYDTFEHLFGVQETFKKKLFEIIWRYNNFHLTTFDHFNDISAFQNRAVWVYTRMVRNVIAVCQIDISSQV